MNKQVAFLNKVPINKLIRYGLFIFSCLFFALATKSYAKNKVTVITEVYPPYQYLDKNNQLQGCSVDVIKTLFQLTKDELTIQVMPWSRTYITALNKKNTLVFTIARIASREPLFHWIGKLDEQKVYFWALKSRDFQSINNLQQLKKYNIAVPKNYFSDIYLTDQGFTSLHRVTIQKQAIAMLYYQRIDLIVVREEVMKSFVQELGFDFAKVKKVFPLNDLNSEVSLAMNLDSDPYLVEIYRKAYQQLIEQGIVKRLMNRCSASLK